MSDRNAEKAGFSPVRLERISTVLQSYIDRQKVAGALQMVARDGQVVYERCFGLADIEAGLPIRPDTLFRIYSMSKPITAAALLTLYEQGCFRLSDPVEAYLPSFKGQQVYDGMDGETMKLVPAKRPVTIHDLFRHTAGMSYPSDHHPLEKLYGQKLGDPNGNHWRLGTTLAEWVDLLAGLPLLHQPGERFNYSVAIDVLGRLVEVFSGQTFERYLAEAVFAPLGMVDTAFTCPLEKLERFSACYAVEDGRLSCQDPRRSPVFVEHPHFPSGGSGLVSTAGDYLRFAQMLLNGGALDGIHLLGRKTVEFMITNHLPRGLWAFDDPGRGYGLGLGVLVDSTAQPEMGSVGNFYWSGAAGTTFWVDPRERLIGLLMQQGMPPDNDIQGDFLTMVYQALE